MITPADLGQQITTELDNWTHEYALERDIDGCNLAITDDGYAIHVEHIYVPADHRHAGLGTAMLAAVTDWADRNNTTVRLHMSVEYGTPHDVLAHFYTSHGFEPINRIGGMSRQPCNA